MVTRGYICDACEHTFEVQQPLHEEKLKKCPQCERETLYQDLRGQYHAIREVKTLGQLAERNTKKLGRYGLDSKVEQERQKKLKKNQEVLKKSGVDLPLEKCEHKPWYGTLNSESATKINKMTTEQKAKYIMDG